VFYELSFIMMDSVTFVYCTLSAVCECIVSSVKIEWKYSDCTYSFTINILCYFIAKSICAGLQLHS